MTLSLKEKKIASSGRKKPALGVVNPLFPPEVAGI